MNIIVITGQTATGKTAFALKLAHERNGELVNADARQIYKKLDIITGKDLTMTTGSFQKIEEMNGHDIGYYLKGDLYQIPLQEGGPPDDHREEGMSHTTRLWLYDIVDPKQAFSTYEYAHCARSVISDIKKRGKLPILVGGSYFYIQHLLYGTVKNEVPPNEQVRSELTGKATEELQILLQSLNNELYQSLNRSEQHNPQRLIRRIEKEMATMVTSHKPSRPLAQTNDVNLIGFQYASRERLAETIRNRVEERLKQGAIDEVKALLEQGYSATDPGLQTIGYQQIIAYVDGALSFDRMKEEWITKEMQYAKRQVTFMKRNTRIHWQKIG